MSFTFKRKQLVFAGLALSLAVAIYVNWYYTRPTEMSEIQTQTTTQTEQVNLGDAQFVNATLDSNYFAQAQLKRSQAQDEAKQSLEEILNSKDADGQSKQSAQKAYEKLVNCIVLQQETENLIKAKSGGEVLVTLGETAEIILQKGTLNDEIRLQIQDIISKKTDISSEKITIIEAK